MQTACIKCGHVNHQASGSTDEACPRCHVIYAKARPRQSAEGRASGFAPTTMFGGDSADYVRQLRTESQYPAFRTVAGVLALLGYLLGILVLIAGLVAGWRMGSAGTMVGGLVGGCLIVLLAKAAKEAAQMLADLSDATLRTAQRQERGA
jgi:predicted  nucleic acid-binding Zn-ribbon protein